MSELEVNSAAKVLKEEREVSRLGGTSSRPDPASFAQECLSAAEEAAEEVLNCIHPTLDSEEERSDVTDHLRRLIKAHVNCDVGLFFSFFPLKFFNACVFALYINFDGLSLSLGIFILSL